MATVTGLTAEKMLELADENIVAAEIVGDNLILTTRGGITIDAGVVVGPAGPTGPVDTSSLPLAGGAMTGAIQLDELGLLDVAGTRKFLWGTGSPEGVVTASRGSLFLRTDGGTNTTMYRKETGDATNTGWVAVSAASTPSFSGMRLRHSVDQNVTTATMTTLTFDTESIDIGGYHSSGNPTRGVAPITGVFEVSFAAAYTEVTAAGQQRKGDICVNGVLQKEFFSTRGAVGDIIGLSGSMILSLTAGDYVEIKVWQNSGSTIAIFGQASVANEPSFEMKYLGP
jgi:hypothetical protein